MRLIRLFKEKNSLKILYLKGLRSVDEAYKFIALAIPLPNTCGCPRSMYYSSFLSEKHKSYPRRHSGYTTSFQNILPQTLWKGFVTQEHKKQHGKWKKPYPGAQVDRWAWVWLSLFCFGFNWLVYWYFVSFIARVWIELRALHILGKGSPVLFLFLRQSLPTLLSL